MRLADLPGRPCPIAASLEVVGERWALLVVREVGLGARRFNEIVAGTGAPRDRIASRLTTLVEAGVLEKRQYQSGPPRFEYHLTDSGRALLPVLEGLLAWGRAYAVSPADPDLKRRRWAPLTDDLPRRPVTETTVREKTVTWDDPMETALAGRGQAGLDFLRSMIAGEVPGPPIASLLGMALVEVEHGRAVFTLTPDESMFNPIGAVHGGVVCTLLDSALGCALHTTLPAGKGYTSVEIKV